MNHAYLSRPFHSVLFFVFLVTSPKLAMAYPIELCGITIESTSISCPVPFQVGLQNQLRPLIDQGADIELDVHPNCGEVMVTIDPSDPDSPQECRAYCSCRSTLSWQIPDTIYPGACSGDFTGDELTNFDDLSFVLSNWEIDWTPLLGGAANSSAFSALNEVLANYGCNACGIIQDNGLSVDLTNDGKINGLDVLALIANWGPYKYDPENPNSLLNKHDLSGNGNVDFYDLLIVLDNWGVCSESEYINTPFG